METIAAEAGVSKLTLYSHFQNKEALFRETVEAKCNEHWPEELFDTDARLPLQDRLLKIGTGFLDLIYSPDVLNLYRLMAAEGSREAAPGQLFWSTGPEKTLRRFAQILSSADAAGELTIVDARGTAGRFFALLQAEHYLRCMVGAARAPAPAARKRHAAETVTLFLRMYARGA